MARTLMRFISSSAMSMESSGEHECSVLVISWCARACAGTRSIAAATASSSSALASDKAPALSAASRAATSSAASSSAPTSAAASESTSSGPRSLTDAAAAAGWPPPFQRASTLLRSTELRSARAEPRPMSDRKGCALALVCTTPSSNTSQPSSWMSSSHTEAMPVTKPRPVSSSTEPNLRPSCCCSSMRCIASDRSSRCMLERRDWPNSAMALCEQPRSISHASACASRAVVAGKLSTPVSARMPRAKRVASVSVSSICGAAPPLTASSSACARARIRSTRIVVAEPTGSMIDSSGSMSPGVGWWSTTHTCSALSSQPPAAPSRSTDCVSTTPTAATSCSRMVLKPRIGSRCLW
mmetsp:Transcript_11942/g.28059  ORF Transcript_11942/g.28059 Transcript_11942/m.28059 type:complete len:355 (+) Transcript_11942:500-1564(+)